MPIRLRNRPDDKTPIELYQELWEGWKDCTACGLHETRKRVVMYKGSVPCDVFFCGEAPGKVENLNGAPFSGPAGNVLDGIIRVAIDPKWGLRLGFGNLLGCIPLEGTVTREPTGDEKAACSPRIVELIKTAAPKLLVMLGAQASKHMPKLLADMEFETLSLLHPSAILQITDTASQGFERQKCIVRLRDAVVRMMEVS